MDFINDETTAILEYLANNESKIITEAKLLEETGLNTTRIRYYLEELRASSYIKVASNKNGTRCYSIAHSGRKFLVDKGLF